MKRIALFLYTLFIITGGAAAQGKLSPYVWQLARRAQAMPADGGRRQAVRGAGGPVCAFVKVTDTDADSLLRRHDSHLLARQGDVCIALIPKHQLLALAAQPAVERIEASRSGRLTMDTTRQVVNALPVYEGTALPQAYDGTGVVMGLMDIGFDLTHPTFLTTDASRSRICRFWDMLSPDTVGSPLPVGRDWDGPSARHSTDSELFTHGTHTLGIAAGTGFDSPFRGMAPGSDICLVSNAVTSDTIYIAEEDYDKYTTATDALGFKYIFDYADAVGQPCVISFSEGFETTFTDDDRLFDEFVDALLGPGHILVTSAGNESGFLTYLHKPAGMAAAGSFINSAYDTFAVSIRSREAFRLSYIFYSGTQPVDTLTIDTHHIAASDSAVIDLDAAYCDSLLVGSTCYKLFINKYASPYNPEDTICYAVFTSPDALNLHHNVALVLEDSDADVELWGNSGSPFYNRGPWTDAQTRSNILKPGTMRRAITVGNTEHRQGVVNAQGNYVAFVSADFPGGISRYSSIGPTPDGLIKPDVCAPGMNIVSAFNSYFLEQNYGNGGPDSAVGYFDFGGRTYAWGADSGTSMSAPVVGGAVALWLQARPTLSPDDVLDVLSRTCRQPDASLTYPNNTYGHGEIDVYAGLLDVLGITDVAPVSLHQPTGVSIRAAGASALQLHFSSRPQHDVRLRLYSLSGNLLADRLLRPESADATVALPSLPAGVYAVQLDGRDDGVTGSTLLRF